jgi:Domain of unknown function (DUF5060)
MIDHLAVSANRSCEWTLIAAVPRADPWREITVEAVLEGHDGSCLRVSAFWDGGAIWRVRLSAAVAGTWHVRSVCSDVHDSGLHGRTAVLTCTSAEDGSRLQRHGAIHLAADGSHFAHSDGGC